MAKAELPIQAFQDLLNVYIGNGWFPWRHKIVKDVNLDKILSVQADGKIRFHAHITDSEEIQDCIYSVAELFSVESGLHDFVSWKRNGDVRQRNGQPPVYDVGYSFQYMNMATMTIGQKMQYFLEMTDLD
jgi:hypothetical protein